MMLRLCFTNFGVARYGRFLFASAAQQGSSAAAKNEQSQDHPKSVLTNVCAAWKWKPPDFEFTQTGTHHQPRFSARVKIFTAVSLGGNEIIEVSSGDHPKKALAIYEASLAACEELKKRGLLETPKPDKSVVMTDKPGVSGGIEARLPLDEMPKLIERHPHLSRLKQHPKALIDKLNAVNKAVNNDYREPKAHFHMLVDKSWACRLSVVWPVAIEFNARAASKSKAEHVAYLKYLQQLRVADYFDIDWQPKFQTKRQLGDLKNSRCSKVYITPIPEVLRLKLDEISLTAKEIENEINTLLKRTAQSQLEPVVEAVGENLEDETEAELETGSDPLRLNAETANEKSDAGIMDIITNKPLKPLDDRHFIERSHELFTRFRAMKSRQEQNMLQLPIATKRQEIIDLLDKGQTLIIAGGTGCGKTTQVPQCIFDDYVQRLEGAQCNVLITQPRRISAIGVAQRVAAERREKLGDTVGYHVRLGFRAPTGHGSMLFATPAIILRQLWSNPSFEGISHVIIDEVHERDLWTDFLLIILKRALKTNKNLKVILMSASMDSEKLSAYFDGCSMVSVEGRNYDVQEHFMDDETEASDSGMSMEQPVTDHQAVVDILAYIHTTRQEGAILCFLPGWADISKVRKLFDERHEGRSNYAIYACHSRLPLDEQELIFKPSPSGVRKIVLATNIAETSITIDDVRYVVNTGLRKNSTTEKNLRSIRQEWASQSSQIQRKGRAGRVSSGECFHLFSKAVFDRMRPFDLPAMVSEPLESVILFCKLSCPTEDPKMLLEDALDRPPIAQIDHAIRLLTNMKLLDEKRNLTTLGAHVARLGCHPMLGLAIVYGAVYRCLEPIVTLTSILQTDGLVKTISHDQHAMSSDNPAFEVKERFVGNAASDHLALVNIFSAYQKALAEKTANEFVDEYGLRAVNLEQSRALRRLFAIELSELGLCGGVEQCLDKAAAVNANAENRELVKAVLAAGLHDHIIWLGKGVAERGRILEGKQRLMDENGYFYTAPSSSLFKSRVLNGSDYRKQLFLFLNKVLVGGAARLFRVDGLSAVHPIAALLYGGCEPFCLDNGTISVLGSRYQLCFSKEDAARLMNLRKLVHQVVEWTLETKAWNGSTEANSVREKLDAFKTQLTSLVTAVIEKTTIEKEGNQGSNDIPLTVKQDSNSPDGS